MTRLVLDVHLHASHMLLLLTSHNTMQAGKLRHSQMQRRLELTCLSAPDRDCSVGVRREDRGGISSQSIAKAGSIGVCIAVCLWKGDRRVQQQTAIMHVGN